MGCTTSSTVEQRTRDPSLESDEARYRIKRPKRQAAVNQLPVEDLGEAVALLRETENHDRRHRKDQIVQFMEANPRLLHAQDESGLTLVHYACYFNKAHALEALLELRADVNQQESVMLRTPLHFACQETAVACVRTLLAHSALLDVKDGNHHTPMESAYFHENKDILNVFRTHLLLRYAPAFLIRDLCAIISQYWGSEFAVDSQMTDLMTTSRQPYHA